MSDEPKTNKKKKKKRKHAQKLKQRLGISVVLLTKLFLPVHHHGHVSPTFFVPLDWYS
jgi:hypothetical protein